MISGPRTTDVFFQSDRTTTTLLLLLLLLLVGRSISEQTQNIIFITVNTIN